MALLPCRECGTQISTAAVACPQCGAPIGKKKPGKLRQALVGAGALLVLFLVVKAATSDSEKKASAVASGVAGASSAGTVALPAGSVAPAAVAASSSAPSAVAVPPLPADEQAFVQAVMGATESYRAAGTDFQKGATRPARAKAVCKAVSSPKVSKWVGTVAKLSTNSDGKGVISISIAKNVELKTWNNTLSDIGTGSLIEPGSKLFNVLGTLNVGDGVVFSGSFEKSETDCYRESSMTLDGSMKNPEYIMKFQSVERL